MCRRPQRSVSRRRPHERSEMGWDLGERRRGGGSGADAVNFSNFLIKLEHVHLAPPLHYGQNGEHLGGWGSPKNTEADVKKLTGFTTLLVILLVACAPVLPGGNGQGSGEVTPIVITAEVGTAVASTVGPAGTEIAYPTPEPPTAIPTLP